MTRHEKRPRFTYAEAERAFLKTVGLRGYYLLRIGGFGVGYCALCDQRATQMVYEWHTDKREHVGRPIVTRGLNHTRQWVDEHQCPALALPADVERLLYANWTPENMMVIYDLLLERGLQLQARWAVLMAKAESEALLRIKNRKQWLQRFPLGGRAPSESVVSL